VPLIKPDILKVDQSLVRSLHTEYHKQVVVRAIVSLARNIGALVVAESIETEDEASLCLELGCDMLQGFYIDRPRRISVGTLADYDEKIDAIATGFQQTMIHRIQGLRSKHRGYERLLRAMVEELSRTDLADMDHRLRRLVTRHPELESLYVLDCHGIQITDTVYDPTTHARHRSAIFRPSPRGTDHSLKESYYLLVSTGISKYTTEPYISLASGNLCETISVAYEPPQGGMNVLCVDVLHSGP